MTRTCPHLHLEFPIIRFTRYAREAGATDRANRCLHNCREPDSQETGVGRRYRTKEAPCQSGRSVVLVANFCKRCTASRSNVSIGFERCISGAEDIFLEKLVSQSSPDSSRRLCLDSTLRARKPRRRGNSLGRASLTIAVLVEHASAICSWNLVIRLCSEPALPSSRLLKLSAGVQPAHLARARVPSK